MKYKLLLLLICAAFYLQAQTEYSYITDRRFHDPTDLVGYNFRPGAVEVKDEWDSEIEPGEYSFGITTNNIYVEGEEIAGVYNVNNTETTEFGFKLTLISARDARMQGNLKVITDKYGYAEALVFRRSNKEKEMIFFLNEIPEDLAAEEKEFFTDKYEYELEDADSLWGKAFRPFLQIQKGSGIQDRLQASDSTSISFYRTLSFLDKRKKAKKKKKDKKAKEAIQEEIQAVDEDVSIEESDDDNNEKVIVAVQVPEIEIDEEELKELKIQGFDPSTLVDETSYEELDPDIKKYIKMEREFFIDVRSIITFEDGTVEDKVWNFKVDNIVEREDEEAGPGQDRYQLDIKTSKGEHVYLYLTSKRTISSFEFNDKQLLMRGH